MKATKKTKDMVLTAFFAVIIAICAWISIPTAIPFTLQTFGVFLALGLLGGKRGTASICVYLLLGIIGIPVFAGGIGGIGVFFGKTGGYMLGWVFAGLAIWAVQSFKKENKPISFFTMLFALVLSYAVGTAWFMIFYAESSGVLTLWSTLSVCVFPFVIPDLIKICLVLLVQRKLYRFVE